MNRSMCTIKMRGMGYRSGSVQFLIDSDGLRVFPKITATTEHALTSFKNKKRVGIPRLDEMLGGGIPQGHMMLVSGNTGCGKTLMCMQYLENGIVDGEKGIYVALEEAVPQLKKTAQEHGWDFEAREKAGDLTFITVDLINIFPDKLLAEIVDAVARTGAKRVVLDSISSIMSAEMGAENVREFLIQLTSYLKSEGITCMFTYLMSMNFGADQGQFLGSLQTNVMRLSSIVDGVILLQYIETDQKVRKLINVLKMRGCNHSRDIVLFEIETGGMRIGAEGA